MCNRFSSCLLIKFRKYSIGPDITTAFGTLWLKDIVDDEEMDFEVLVRKGDMKRAVLNATEYGEVFGTLKLKVRFWPGLSGYHQGIASSDRNIADVMEVLDAAEDARELENHCAPVSGESYSSSSSSSDNDSGSDSSSGLGRRDEGRRGYKEELKEYKKNRKDIHRRHRGLMQWRGARKAAWVGQGVKVRSKGWGKDVKARWKHQPHSGSGDAVETEV